MNTANNSHQVVLAPSLDLRGKKVVIVGGKTGIGLGIARAARASGATVIVASRRIASIEERPDLTDFEQISLDMHNESTVRAGKAEDIAHAALFLMTNPYVTGTIIEVSGGENLVPSVS